MKRIAFALALAACSDPPAAIDAAVEPTAPAVRTLADLIEGASAARRDVEHARDNAGPVSAYLIARAGGIGWNGRPLEDVSLLLAWERAAVRVTLGTLEVPVAMPFGTVTAVPAFSESEYDSARDAFPGAPSWHLAGAVLFATTIVDANGLAHAYVVRRDGDQLLGETVASSASTWDAQAPWATNVWVTLGADSPLSLPEPVIDPALGDRVRVRILESVWGEAGSGKFFDTALRIGGRVGPLLEQGAENSLDEPWDLRPRTRVISPPRGEILASRRYRVLAQDQNARVLVRDGDDLVMWWRGSSPTWSEELRVPLPRGAEVTVR